MGRPEGPRKHNLNAGRGEVAKIKGRTFQPAPFDLSAILLGIGAAERIDHADGHSVLVSS